MIDIAIANEQSSLEINTDRLREVVTHILSDANLEHATISITIVDDRTIHDLNRRFLGHDCPTDVLSFVLERNEERLDGEIVVSVDHALASAHEYRWSADDELLLYVIHGALHLVGYDDADDTSRAMMQQRERHYLLKCGITPLGNDR